MFQPYATILANLSRPLPPGCIAKRPQSGGDIRYVPWYVVTEMLDHYAPGWTAEPVDVREVCGNLMVKVALTLRTSDGDFTQYALGWDEKTESDDFGGPIPKAYACAVRRAAEMFGLGRYLRSVEDQVLTRLRRHWDDEGKPVDPEATQAVVRNVVAASRDERAQNWHDLRTLFMDTCLAHGFQAAAVNRWLMREYGKGGKGWTTRDLTVAQFTELLARLGVNLETGETDETALTRHFDAKQLRFLRAQTEPDEVDAAPVAS